ncbi:hypothetical protein BV22DRAFT_595560 [Leucogyrophana mollusca]|uniref:Uncharacterized protein n=1 Tax=Leucogyrophana mollusca TaxID=85980 RepID=A0ACB8BC43_9AGAM|nr:hypothetical protein BV22DRAFT_595560 [Leucogyrophana mollusca]
MERRFARWDGGVCLVCGVLRLQVWLLDLDDGSVERVCWTMESGRGILRGATRVLGE